MSACADAERKTEFSGKDDVVITDLIARARAAQARIRDYTQEQIDELCVAVGWQVYHEANIEACARLAVEETGMGNVRDKMTKHRVKVLSLLNEIRGKKTVGLIGHDRERGIRKYAKPVGVVGALTPVTNPTATPASNALAILKGGNAVIFAPHPKARQACKLACDFMRKGLRAVGAPEDLILNIEEPSVARSQELMRRVDLVLATGGAAMVKAAYSSSTPAYGVGAGNPVVIIAEDADIEDAAGKIALSKTFDFATSCSSESSLVIHADIYDQFKQALAGQGGYLLNRDQRARLEDYMWVMNAKLGKRTLNPALIARPATEIATGAGIDVPAATTMLMVEGVENGRFMGEKLSPVLALRTYTDFDQAIATVDQILEYAGLGHSCGIHTSNQDYIDRLGRTIRTSRVMVRQPHAPACGGNFFNGMPCTTTLGCGTWGGNITTENIHWKHFINVTWVSEPITPNKPADEEIFGEYWQKHGKEQV